MKLHKNGIKCAIFDVDCTILPFDDCRVPEKLVYLFDHIKEVGITPGLYSSGPYKRVMPVADELNIRFISNAGKPFRGDFKLIKENLFNNIAKPGNTMMVGDSFYLDMVFAKRLGLYKVMVDPVKGGAKIKTLINDFMQTSVYSFLPKEKFKVGKYYHGDKG